MLTNFLLKILKLEHYGLKRLFAKTIFETPFDFLILDIYFLSKFEKPKYFLKKVINVFPLNFKKSSMNFLFIILK